MRDFEIIRSKRKTLSIQITRDARVVVRAPLRMAEQRIIQFVKEHENWIEKHSKNAEISNDIKKNFDYTDGQILYYFGEKYVFCTSIYITSVQVMNNELQVSDKIAQENREPAVKKFLSKQAGSYLEKRVNSFAERMGVSPQHVSITSAKTRWGSCSGKDRICFSYRLICLPPDLIDYVVVHELAHIKQHNHSDKFYAEIEKVLPDYAIREKNLKEFSKKLTL